MSTKRRSRYAGGVALVGYARVSTREQHPEGQTDALNAAGCEKVFVEHVSGVLARRPVFDETLRYLREGDTLVVTKLDRLGRSVRNLKQIAAIAEFEHDLIVERTQDGLAAARARGRKGGPKFKMTATKIAQARAMYDAGGRAVQEIADTFGVSRPTVYRHLARPGPAGAK